MIPVLLTALGVGGATVLLTMLPATLAGATLFGVCQRFFSKKERENDTGECEESLLWRMEGIRRQDSTDRFRGISDAFSSLSEMFYNLSDRFR